MPFAHCASQSKGNHSTSKSTHLPNGEEANYCQDRQTQDASAGNQTSASVFAQPKALQDEGQALGEDVHMDHETLAELEAQQAADALHGCRMFSRGRQRRVRSAPTSQKKNKLTRQMAAWERRQWRRRRRRVVDNLHMHNDLPAFVTCIAHNSKKLRGSKRKTQTIKHDIAIRIRTIPIHDTG